MIGACGVLYGTTWLDGSGSGTVFQLTPPASPGGAWTETTLYSFTGGSDGGNPVASLVIGDGGVLYGTSSGGGASNAGTVFALKPPTSAGGSWTETVLYSFTARTRSGGSPRKEPSPSIPFPLPIADQTESLPGRMARCGLRNPAPVGGPVQPSGRTAAVAADRERCRLAAGAGSGHVHADSS